MYGESVGQRSILRSTRLRMWCFTSYIRGESLQLEAQRPDCQLNIRIPHYPAPTLTALWRSKTPEHTTRVLKYYFQRVVMYCEVIDAAEIITKNASVPPCIHVILSADND